MWKRYKEEIEFDFSATIKYEFAKSLNKVLSFFIISFSASLSEKLTSFILSSK
jgi:hypothetical protein